MKNYTSSNRFLYLSHKSLVKAAELAIRHDYNRQLDLEKIKALPKYGHFLITMALPHYHRHFERCEEHMRLVLEWPKDFDDLEAGMNWATVDVPLFFISRIKTLDVAVAA
jgi:hypothetical protein